MPIGYARDSTVDQNPDLQEDGLQKTDCFHCSCGASARLL